MEITLRKPEPSDYDAAERLMEQVHALHVEWRPDVYRMAEPVLSREEFLNIIDSGCGILAVLGGDVIGLAFFKRRLVASPAHTPRESIFIDSMAVDEAYRGQGAGRLMLSHIAQLARARGMDAVELQVNAKNSAAKAMYGSFGFNDKSINMEYILGKDL